MATPPPQKKAPPKAGGGMGTLTKKVGPLPVWGYIAVVVVGYLIYRKMKGSSASASTAATAGGAAAGTAPTETITLPSGASYTGPAGAAPQGCNWSGGNGSTPGGGTSPGQGGTTPGNGGGQSGAYPGYTLIGSNVANTVQADLTAGTPVEYSAGQGQALVPVTQPGGAGTGWLFGGSSAAPGTPGGAPGQPSGYYVKSAA